MLPARRISLAVLAAASMFPGIVSGDTLSLHAVGGFHKGQAAFAFDSSRRHLVVIGGQDRDPDPSPDPNAFVQILDVSGPVAAWSRPVITGTPPPAPLIRAPAVFDPVRDRVVVLADSSMWSLSLSAPMQWTHVVPTGTAPTTTGSEVIYDPVRDRIVGFGRAGDVSATWQLSLGATPAWAPLSFIGAVPPWRTDGAVAYDPASDRMIVTSGDSQGDVFDQVWQLAFSGIPTWSLLPTTGTPHPITRDAPYAFDPATRNLYLFGGAFAGQTTSRLALASGTWTTLPFDSPPRAREGAASAWDAAGSRMLVAGGLSGPLGDLWQYKNGWSEIPASGGAPSKGVVFANYDAAAHRFAATVLGAPAFFSMPDSTWTIAGPVAFQFRTLDRFYDPGRNLFGVNSADSLYTIHPFTDSDWTTTGTSGTRPTFGTPGTVYADPPNHRVLLFGGETIGPGPDILSEELFAIDELTGTWTRLQQTTPIGRRHTVAMHDVRRNRLVFFGGGITSVSSGATTALNDTWVMDLSTLAWTQLAPQGPVPDPRFYFPAAYDSLRDRCVVFGGIQFGVWLHGVYYLQFAPGDANGTWSRNDPAGDPVPDLPGMVGDLDPGLDRFFVPYPSSQASPTHFFHLEWGLPESIVAACPPKTPWTPGANLPLTFVLRQGSSAPVNYAWSLASQRAWPGFPLSGFQQLSDTTAFDLMLQVPVPDSVTVGIDTLTFTITDGTHADSCTVAIGDAASPAIWALIEALAERGRVRVAWWTADRAQSVADIERRSFDGMWEPHGSVPIDGDGIVRFEDDAVDPGVRYGYRAGVGGTWSDEARVDVPSVVLAFAHRGFVGHGALAVTFTLPAEGPARLEAFDVAGRRVAAKDTGGAGVHTMELAPAGVLPGGVYFLRLTQDGAQAKARAVVLGGRD